MTKSYASVYFAIFLCAATACGAEDLYRKLDQNLEKILPSVSPKKFEELSISDFRLNPSETGPFKNYNDFGTTGSADLNSFGTIESFRNLEILNSGYYEGGNRGVLPATPIGPIDPVGGIVPIAPTGAIQFNYNWGLPQYAALPSSAMDQSLPAHISSKIENLLGFIPVYRKHKLSIGCSSILKSLGLQLVELGNQSCDGEYIEKIKSSVSIYISDDEREYIIELIGPSDRFIGKPGVSRDLFMVVSSIDMNFDFGVKTYSHSHHYASDASSTYWRDVGSLEDRHINNFKTNIDRLKRKMYSTITIDLENSLRESQ